MYRRLRNVFIIGAFIILAAGFVRYRMEQNQPILPVGDAGQDVAAIEAEGVVERGDIQVSVSATGTINPAEQLRMLFPLTGKVSEIHVEEGDNVSEGQELAKLDTRNLDLAMQDAGIALEQQQITFDNLLADPREADLVAAQAAVYAASSQLEAARVAPDERMVQIAEYQYELALNQLWQQQARRDSVAEQREALEDINLSIPGVSIPTGPTTPPIQTPPLDFSPLIVGLMSGQLPTRTQSESAIAGSEIDVQIAEQQYIQAQNQTANASNIAGAQAALAGANANLNRLLDGPDEVDIAMVDAQLQLAYLSVEQTRHQLSLASLHAPFSGTVAQVNLTVGESPPTGQPAIELLDTSSFHIDLAVDEIDIAQVHEGQRVEIVLDALPAEILTGVVSRIDDVADDFGGLITYRVKVTLDPTDVQVRTGMSATATIIVDEVFDVLRVRNRFIRLDRRLGLAYVVVRRPDGSLEEIEVTLGQRNDTYSEIVEGLSEGDSIVLLPRDAGITDYGF